MSPEELVALIDAFAPFDGQVDGDSSGLVARGSRPIRAVLVSLEADEQAIENALAGSFDALVCHHPPTVGSAAPRFARRLRALDPNGVLTVVACHTNADATHPSFVDELAEFIGLRDTSVIEPVPVRNRVKIVTFAPHNAVTDIVSRTRSAGAGLVGRYEGCTFRTDGIGTFWPDAGACPASGEAGRLNEVAEVRLEFEARRDDLARVLETVWAAHPYEEPVVEVYAFERFPRKHGIGRVGTLPRALAPKEFERLCREVFPSARLTVGREQGNIASVALCPGSGRRLVGSVIGLGADAFVTGDLGYHDRLEAEEAGVALVEADHDDLEAAFVPWMRRALADIAASRGHELEVVERTGRARP